MPNTAFSPRAFTRFLLLSLVLAAAPALAHDYKIGALAIGHPWARATPGGAKIAGGYLKITNNGTTPDRLVGGSAEIARVIEIHEMTMEGGMMRMRALDHGIEIKPGETVELKPGGYHVMLIDIARPLKPGETIKGELQFEKAGKVAIEYKIEKMGAAASKHESMNHDAKNHDDMKGHGEMKNGEMKK